MAMRIFTAPFGGAVTQAFDIWSNWFQNIDQFGFINIDLGNTRKPELERKILTEVGSYGRQIGWMSEALAVVIEQADLDQSKLSPEQICALRDFDKMVKEVRRCKEAR